jgi:hypothetical protein
MRKKADYSQKLHPSSIQDNKKRLNIDTKSTKKTSNVTLLSHTGHPAKHEWNIL